MFMSLLRALSVFAVLACSQAIQNYTWNPHLDATYRTQFASLGPGPQSYPKTIRVIGRCPVGYNYVYASVHAAKTDFPTNDRNKYMTVSVPMGEYASKEITCSGMGANDKNNFAICFQNEDVTSSMNLGNTIWGFTVYISRSVGMDAAQQRQVFMNATLTLECSAVQRSFSVTTVPIDLRPAAAVLGMTLMCCLGIACLVIIAKILFWYFCCKYFCLPAMSSNQRPTTVIVQQPTQVQQPLMPQPYVATPVHVQPQMPQQQPGAGYIPAGTAVSPHQPQQIIYVQQQPGHVVPAAPPSPAYVAVSQNGTGQPGEGMR